MEFHLEGLADEKMPIPEASQVDDFFGQAEYSGWIWAVVEIDIIPYLGKSQKINVTLPDLLIKQIDDCVTQNKAYKTRSGFLQAAAIHALHEERSKGV